MRKTLLFISLFMIILSIAYSDDDLSMKESSPNKDAYMLSLPTAYIIPKGQMRIQVTYNFNPFQTYFDLHDDYYNYNPIIDSNMDIHIENCFGLSLNYSITSFLQLGLVYSKNIWKAKKYYERVSIHPHGMLWWQYDDFSNEVDLIELPVKLRIIKEKKYFPETSIFTQIYFINESIKSSEQKPISDIPELLTVNYHKSKQLYSITFPALILSKTIEFNEKLNFIFSYLISLAILFNDDFETFTSSYFQIYQSIRVGYENRMTYIQKYHYHGDRFFRRSSETKYFLAWNPNEKFQLQGCYLIHKGSKYLNYKYNKYGFGLTYNFKILKGKK